MDSEAVVKEVFSLYETYGDVDYIGEAVTQRQHALQAARFAEEEEFPAEIILGALLHDVGHLAGMRDGSERMTTNDVTLGAANHDVIGAEYLARLGFPPAVTAFVRYHVQAKRFLVATDAGYYETLTEASRMTLDHQGGPMTEEEARTFAQDPQFDVILRMRRWDERAKDPEAVTPPLEHYKDMCLRFLQESEAAAAAAGEAGKKI
ncbi:2-amino-1-hydroxyethylphosphonate dioxygenase (glycine-forming)-like [Penaeus chinensis]|uniref:2-amino-1-hydroxyethylphosphonate dioxygenase (glycine-forming)-like n=1 Tax=Penaeus chinensis TaxID=139456 RepID=UPI001FB77298|nr:2-amino-1-hydroxyethylphosphonate dioxygenase (glycine-forming)-like [Penaeus chinensis]